MTLQEQMQDVMNRFKNGETTPEEDLEIATALNSSLELTKIFLDEIKVEQKRQEIINSN